MRKPKLGIRWRIDGIAAEPGCVAVVVDVLRASTTITTLFSRRVEQVAVTREIDEARQLASRHAYVLIGERKNRKIDGFDFSSSPSILQHEDFTGRSVAFTSTNFPHALHEAADAGHILIGAVVNVSAAAGKAFDLASRDGVDIRIMLAGEPVEARAFEDLYFAGLACGRLADRCSLEDEAIAAIDAVRNLSSAEAADRSKHAGELVADGLEADVEFAFTRDRFDIVPVYRDGRFHRG